MQVETFITKRIKNLRTSVQIVFYSYLVINKLVTRVTIEFIIEITYLLNKHYVTNILILIFQIFHVIFKT